MVRPNRREFLVGASGSAALGMFGLLGSGCARHIRKDPRVSGRKTGAFADWSLISPRERLFDIDRTDVVIIGSGYGGAVTAARLAAAGAKVVVLERGQEWLPGDFPETLSALMGSARAVDPMGLIDMYTPTDSDLDVLCASGIGGTSLINAAISTIPERLVLDQPEWPEAIRGAAKDGSLAGHYQRASNILSPNQYVGPDPMKVEMHRYVASSRKGSFSYLPLNISYQDATRGDAKWPVQTHQCSLCGNCTTGCNIGAKGTLQTNYLPRARAAGALLFAGIDVDRVEKKRSTWRVHYHALTASTREAKFIDADHVIVAGGSLGSTEILMRSGAAGLALSPLLGTRVSANGDMFGFCYNGDFPTNLVGERSATASGTVGNALMSYIDYRGDNALGPELQDHFLLLESTIPVAVANSTAKALAAYALVAPDKFSEDQLDRARRDLTDPDTHAPDGALAYSTLYLACGHDDSNGRYIYRAGKRPRIAWNAVATSKFYKTITAEMQEYTKTRNGFFLENPRTTLFGGRLIVPHPLGGCPMANDIRTGVVDDRGRVFDPSGAPSAVHRGLHVLDGSIIPRSLGVTPLLTISALAERASEQLRS
ncbi:MAG: GMC family oxidoreductase N-terminal domain-containing protein [Kofleriaceae bacterium]